MAARIDEAVEALSAREARVLMARLEKRLRACIIDGNDGAVPVAAQLPKVGTRGGTRITLLLCPACIERHRLPPGESTIRVHEDGTTTDEP